MYRPQVSVVTGAASGIGRALALQLAARGSDLALADLDSVGLEDTIAQARALGVLVTSARLDVSDREAFEAFAAETLSAHRRPIELVINNAGVGLSQTVADVSYEDLEWIMGINFWGVVYGTKAFLPYMLERDRGKIVNISSLFGLISISTQGAYNATKFAVRGFTEALRQELTGTGVQAHCVHPGGINTRIAENSRFYRSPLGDTDREASIERFRRLARTSPDQAAQIILQGLDTSQERILIGSDARLFDRIQRLFPEHYHRVIRLIFMLTRALVKPPHKPAPAEEPTS